jgi:hypothetical protein
MVGVMSSSSSCVVGVWSCGAVADGWHVLLGANHVVVACALWLVVAVLHHLWPAFLVAWP